MPYTKNPTWRAGSTGGTPITPDALNRIEDGIANGSAHFDAEAYRAGRTDLQAIHAACAAATAAGPGNVVRLSARVWDVGAGLSMAGYTCGLIGMGVGFNPSPWPGSQRGSVLHATSQAGPVLDLTGWVSPSFAGRLTFGDFGVRGSGVADAAKLNAGIKRVSPELCGVNLRDIVIQDTGGPCLDIATLYLSDVERIACLRPVLAAANDVPYAVFTDGNGNRITGLGFFSPLGGSVDGTATVGPSGALRVIDCSGNVWTGTWFENTWLPADGTLIYTKSTAQRWVGTYFVDIGVVEGSTGTSTVHIDAPATDWGQNIWDGLVPGTPTDTGILVSSSGNRIVGPRGYSGYTGSNVTLAAGVAYNHVELTGGASTVDTPGIIDNSGTIHNYCANHVDKAGHVGNAAWDVFNSGPRFMYNSDKTGGTIAIGNAGAHLSASVVGGVKNLTIASDVTYLSGISAASDHAAFLGAYAGIQLGDHGHDLPPAAAYYRGKVAFKWGAVGVADRLVVCRMKADGAYEWASLI